MLGLNRVREALLSKRDAREVVEAVMSLKERERAMCCHALWLGWFECNRVREGELMRDTCYLSHGIQVRVEEWNKKAVQSPHSARRLTCKWEKPVAGIVKVL